MATHGGKEARPWSLLLTGTTGRSLLLGRFTGLTVVLILLFVLAAVTEQSRVHVLVIDLAMSLLLGFAIFTVGRPLRLVAWLLAIPTFVGQWLLGLNVSLIPQEVVLAFTLVFLCFVAVVVLGAVLADEAVTTDTIVGAVCVYFLLGIIFGCAYAWIAVADPNAFSMAATLRSATGADLLFSPLPPLLQYYSFTTLSTLGFGDITPVSPVARSLSVIEGFSGQLYLAVLIARLVGRHATTGDRHPSR